MGTLREWLTSDYFESNYPNYKQMSKMFDLKVKGYGGPNEPNKLHKFQHKYVVCWCEVENGYSVGFNENPGRGWSFPIIKTR